MDGQYYQRSGQRGHHYGPTVVYSRPLVHNPMPASHNYIRNGPTEKAKGYDGWVASRDKEESVYAHDDAFIEEDECNEKEFGGAEATEGYSNMRQEDNMNVKPPAAYSNMRQEDNMIVKQPAAFIDDEYDDDHDHDKVFAAPEPTKGYTNMRPAVREKDEHMFVKNPMFSEGDQYNTNNNKMYSAEAGNGYPNMRPAPRPKEDNMYALNPALTDDDYGYNTYSPPEAGRAYMNMQKPVRPKEDMYALSRPKEDMYALSRPKEDMYASRPFHGDDHQYTHQMYSGEGGRGYPNMNHRQGARRKEEAMYALSTVLSDDDYGRKMYSGDGGRGYMNVTQQPRHRADNMFALNPVLSDDDYNYKVYSAPAAQGYGNMRHGVKEDMFLSNQAYGRAEFADNKMYYKTSHMEPAGMKKAVACGPWGGNTGNLFDDGAFTGIREIQLTRSGSIVSIRVCYDMEGKAVWGNKNGGSHGMKVDKIVLEYPSEYLTHITGYYGSMLLRGPTVLKSLTFYTNKRKYGPFGDEQGISFSSAGPREGKIVGFSGRIKNWYVESIGVHVMEGRTTTRPAYDAFNMSGMRMRLEY